MKLEVYNLKIKNEIYSLIKAFLPMVEIEVYEDFSDEKYAYIDLSFEGWERETLHADGTFKLSYNYLMVSIPKYYEIDDAYEQKNYVKKRLYMVLKKMTGKDLPWGTLTGIRPTKLVSKLLLSMSEDGVNKHMRRVYLLSKEKTELAIKIAKTESKILEPVDYKNGYSLYVNIPFCPTRCAYCSFTSYPIKPYLNKIDDYLSAIDKELKGVAIAAGNKKLQTIYVGGGTPTTLDADKLDKLLNLIENNLDLSNLLEITVEAGRPDSITKEKLEVLKRHGVNRISINPQTMCDKTLEVIGRRHTSDDIKAAYALAREAGIDNINMDIILGLPGETLEDVERTVSEIKKLRPDNFTIHSLAIKRAAKLNKESDIYAGYEFNNSDAFMSVAMNAGYEMGLKPYYLYRQKNMKGNLENVGMACPGKACLYNILIMEEKQTIYGVGAGASTKYVDTVTGEVTRAHNPKDINQYLNRILY